jgi:hypothetical protein
VRVGEGVAVWVEVNELRVGVVVVFVGGRGAESSALAGLTLNCRIGQKIKVTISNNIDEEVSTTPRENLVREG